MYSFLLCPQKRGKLVSEAESADEAEGAIKIK